MHNLGYKFVNECQFFVNISELCNLGRYFYSASDCFVPLFKISAGMSDVISRKQVVLMRSPHYHDLFSRYHEIILCARLNTWCNFYFTMSY